MNKIMELKEECCGCGACETVCPHNAIVLAQDCEGFAYPSIDKNICINCNLCEKVCPVLSSTLPYRTTIKNIYAARNSDLTVRMASSSGGVFSSLAEYVLNNHGLVFGVEMAENCLSTQFGVAESIEQLVKLRGSKYIQPCVNQIYKKVKFYLQQGKMVLFVGCPCHIAALRSYLGQEYESLLLVDLICHGTSSSFVWKQYIKEITQNVSSQITHVNFRDKQKGWRNYSLAIEFNNGSRCVQDNRNNLFYLAFNQDLCLRPSCSFCSFKGLNHQSDITLGDYWGIEHNQRLENDDKGTSIIITHNVKGERFISNCRDYITVIQECDKNVLQHNISYYKNARMNPRRDEFFIGIEKNGFKRTLYKCTGIGLLQLIRRFVNTVRREIL